MKNLKCAFLVVVFMSLAGLAVAAEMGSSGGHDLDDLWAQAQAAHDLSAEDAVLLLESRSVTLAGDGAVTTSIHQVVWIGTSTGIRGYADLRVPWDTAASRLEVEILRTWRDETWWPHESRISETAVVPTLPHALRRADDYTTLRETMLLHDGVELPCIMETVYTITETGLPAADGQFVFPQRDPAVLTELNLSFPRQFEVRHAALNGAPEPRVSGDEETTTLTWSLTGLPGLLTPVNQAPAAYEPTVIWSTWSDWVGLRDQWRQVFDEAAVLDEALADSVAVWTEPAPSPWSKIQAVVEAVNQNVRAIHYPDRFWRFEPRPALRTWDTAYGHRTDRAVLAAALLREAGFEVTPVFVGSGNQLVGEGLARLAGMGELHLSIKSDPAGLYDPDTGVLTGQAPLIGTPLLRTDQFYEPFLGNSQWHNRLEVSLTLEPGEEGAWQGSGHYHAGGVFCPQGEMAGLADGAKTYLTGEIEGLLAGTELSHANPEIFHQHQVVFGFGFALDEIEPETSGRTRLTLGEPAHGLLNRLPGVHLHHESRQSPVVLAGPLEQAVKIRLEAGEDKIAHLPAPVSLVNEAGTFAVTTAVKDGWVTVERKLTLTEGTYPAEMWPTLRALLLEEADPRHGTILLD